MVRSSSLSGVGNSNEISHLADLCDDWISELFPDIRSLLRRAEQYAMRAPGKRIRPILSIFGARALGIEEESVKHLAVAIECVHTATLIHDDLPGLDNDTLRRGLPTTHVKYGEGVAVLTGDALLARAFTLIHSSPIFSHYSKSELSGLLGRAIEEICEGQVLDLGGGQGEGREDLSQLETRHRKKTGALIAAAVSGPAKILPENKGSDRLFNLLHRFGLELGLLFQITDDLLDATQSTEVLGKHANSDERLGRSTYVTFFGVDGAREVASKKAQELVEMLAPLGRRAGDLHDLISWIVDRTY